MENTEKFVICQYPEDSEMYFNNCCKFRGNLEDAKEYAIVHNYGGGIEIDYPEPPDPEIGLDEYLAHTGNDDDPGMLKSFDIT